MVLADLLHIQKFEERYFVLPLFLGTEENCSENRLRRILFIDVHKKTEGRKKTALWLTSRWAKFECNPLLYDPESQFMFSAFNTLFSWKLLYVFSLKLHYSKQVTLRQNFWNIRLARPPYEYLVTDEFHSVEFRSNLTRFPVFISPN